MTAKLAILLVVGRCSDMSSAVRDCLQAYLAAQWLFNPFQESEQPVSLTPQQAMKKFANTPLVLVNMPQSFSVGHCGCNDQVAQLKCIEAWCQCCAIGGDGSNTPCLCHRTEPPDSMHLYPRALGSMLLPL